MNRSQLADAMLKGKNTPGVVEHAGYYLERSPLCWACALGCAVIGFFAGDFHKAETELEKAGCFDWECDEVGIISGLLAIPRELGATVELMHLNDKKIEEIAAWLKSSEQQE
jgi:hypothetical protein